MCEGVKRDAHLQLMAGREGGSARVQEGGASPLSLLPPPPPPPAHPKMFRVSQLSSRQTRRVFGLGGGKRSYHESRISRRRCLAVQFHISRAIFPITWQCVRLEGGGGGKVHPPLHRLKQAVGSLCQKRLPPPSPPPHTFPTAWLPSLPPVQHSSQKQAGKIQNLQSIWFI